MSPSINQIKEAVEQTKTLGDTIQFGREALAVDPVDLGLLSVAYYALQRQYTDRPHAVNLASFKPQAAELEELLANALSLGAVITGQQRSNPVE